MSTVKHFPKITPEEAVADIFDGAMVAFSGFGNAGAAKVVPRALAARAREQHTKGEPFKMRLLSGGACGVDIDEVLAQARVITWRYP